MAEATRIVNGDVARYVWLQSSPENLAKLKAALPQTVGDEVETFYALLSRIAKETNH
ncbi:MAG TPA: hypothetical protein PLY23_09425 [Alphaproteobacteria bacterium]|nr:hypothetical protein [Alphaproteobacteria bacterium]HQS94820.1 hypothetical protein [Alphaproteobacteria bacterium]